MPEIRGTLKQIEKRREYIRNIRVQYGIDIEEFRLKDGQKCGYFHITCPVFLLSQAPGDEPVGFREPITEYTELVMKYRVIEILSDDWYRKMCEEWSRNNPFVGERREWGE